MTGPAKETGKGERRGSVTASQSFSQLPAFVRQSIIVGCPKEVKEQEDRVGLTPSAAAEYLSNGHEVVIQSGAGVGSNFSDERYRAVGCKVVKTAEEVFGSCHMIVKVKEPQPSEFNLIREGQVVFTYFHFAAHKDLTNAMIKNKSICVAYETVEAKDRTLPLLTPMSEIAGRMSIQEGAKFLEKPMGGKGILLSGVPGVNPARIVILGGGVVGFNAAKMAAGTGARVIIMDINMTRLRYLDDVLPRNCRTLYCNADNVRDELTKADVVIGAVLIPGAKAPKLVRKEMIKTMKPGTVMVDVSVDQGGCFETTKCTTHKDPIYFVDGVMHYCVGNMAGAVPNTSTQALNNATLKYGLELANKGWFQACKDSEELKKGLNIVMGTVVEPGVAQAFDLNYVERDTFVQKLTEEECSKSMKTLISGLSSIKV